jgi:hypothetical protein
MAETTNTQKITMAALAITSTCALVTHLYNVTVEHEIRQSFLIWIALVMCVFFGIFLAEKKEENVNVGEKLLLYLSTIVLLFTSVTGINVSATNVFAPTKEKVDVNAQKIEAGLPSFFQYLVSTIPMFGVTQQIHKEVVVEYSTAQDSLYAILAIESVRNNTAVKEALARNKNNTKLLPSDTTLHFIPITDTSDVQRESHFWVYLGQKVNEKWKPKNFKFNETPIVGSSVIAKTSVYKRDAAPRQLTLEGDEWQLGIINGVVKANQAIKLVEVRRITGDNYWACATKSSGNLDSAQYWESKGFEFLFNKDINSAIDAFQKSENSLNGYHMVYDIRTYLQSQKKLTMGNDKIAWKTIFKTIGEKYSWKMPTSARRRLNEVGS